MTFKILCTTVCLWMLCLSAPPPAFPGDPKPVDVLVDPGHSPASPGATSCLGEPEYRYNDALAQVILSLLGKAGISAALTRMPDEDAALVKRAGSARGKRLFLSIHHDSVQPRFIRRDNGGNPCSFKAQGYSIFLSRKNSYFKESLEYARTLGKSLVNKGLKPALHHAEDIAGERRELIDPAYGIYAFDDLLVLACADSPALLLEAAVIVNPDDEKRASSAEYRKAIAEAVLDMATQTTIMRTVPPTPIQRWNRSPATAREDTV